jgi:hypothetical protein
MDARKLLLWLFPTLSLVACTSDRDGEPIEALPGYVIHGELPGGVSIEDVVAEVPAGGVGVVGDPTTGKMATIVPTSTSGVSSHFSVTTPASCTDCGTSCDNTTRTIAIGLTQDSGPEATPLRVQEHSSMNFGSPEHSPSSWISSVGSDVNISTTGTISTCGTFSHYFDVVECAADDDCVCTEGTSNCDGNPGCELDHAASPNTCATASLVGSACGDTSCGFVCAATTWQLFATQTGDTSEWFRAVVEECSVCSADLQARLTLHVPDGIDYDLRVYSQCGSLWAASTNGPGESETVTLTVVDNDPVDDTTNYWVEVQYASGSSCEPWTLQFEGRNCP